ncbi:MAG: hypothetical protein Q9159_004180 [Coniocarpon cinnabarinum]
MAPSLAFDKYYNIIDGKQRGSSRTHNGINPSTKEKLWDVPIGSEQDVNDAVAAGKRAQKEWGRKSLAERKEVCKKFVKLFKAHMDQFTELIMKECGKPKYGAEAESGGVLKWWNWHLGLDMPEEHYEDEDKVVTTTYKPLGVVGGIIPWNFPLTLSIGGKVAPAVVSGCAIIIKPSPFTPYSGLKAVELAQEVFPPGLVQAVGGDDAIGPMLTHHPDIAKISFTGSIATGKKVMAACAGTLKRVTLELGGNDPAIVLPDVDIPTTAKECSTGAWFNSGQVCVDSKRIFVHQDIYKEFLAAMIEVTKTFKVGPSSEEGVMLGPIQNSMQYEKVKGFFEDSKKQGYKFAHGDPDVAASKGYFVNPTIIDNPPSDSKIWSEEPFGRLMPVTAAIVLQVLTLNTGPIVPCQPWSDEEDVIARANDTNTGLAACVYGKDIARAQRIAQRIESGSVFVNSFEKPSPEAFFGGVKESGIGGEWGKNGILAYCNAHVMHTYKRNVNAS